MCLKVQLCSSDAQRASLWPTLSTMHSASGSTRWSRNKWGTTRAFRIAGKSLITQGIVARFDASRFSEIKKKRKSLRGVGKLPDLARIVAELTTLFHGCFPFRGLPGLAVQHVGDLRNSCKACFAFQMIELLFNERHFTSFRLRLHNELNFNCDHGFGCHN